MSWLILIGISLLVGFLFFLINTIKDKESAGEYLGGGVLISICVFFLLLMIFTIHFSNKYTPPVNLDDFELIQEEYHPLADIIDDKYIFLDIEQQNINFVYLTGRTPIIVNEPIELVKIQYCAKEDGIAHVYINHLQPKSWLANHFQNYELVTYIIYLPTEENIYIGGNP